MKSGSSIFQNLKLKPASNSNNNINHNSTNQGTNRNNVELTNKKINGITMKPCAEFDAKIIKLEKTKMPCNYLTSHLLNKMGPSYLVGYLGSAILTKGKTGLGCLQQPLRELYSIFRQNDPSLLQERRLGISLDGLTMFFNELGVEKFLHNDLASVYDVQLLKLVCEPRKDKKTHWAFLPLGEEKDICYSNLFQPIDKVFNRASIENIVHPLIIALIMRRSTGIQALECHVIIARNPTDAHLIVNEINDVCNKYKHNINQKTNVFQYTPYQAGICNENANNVAETKNYELDINVLNQLQQKEKIINQQSFLINQPNPSQVNNNNTSNNNNLKLNSQPFLPKFSPLVKAKCTHQQCGQQCVVEKNKEIKFINHPSRDSSVDPKSRSSSASNKNNINKIGNNNLKLQSKSSSNMSTTKNQSVFSKIKHNLLDKSSYHSHSQKSNETNLEASGAKKQKKTEIKAADKQKNSNSSSKNTSLFNKLASSSAVLFSDKKVETKTTIAERQHQLHHQQHMQQQQAKKKIVSTKTTSTSTDFDINNIKLTFGDNKLAKRPSSAFAICTEEEKAKQNTAKPEINLKNPSLISFTNLEDSLNKQTSSKREKKPSFGKRLLMSARSSLKSNSSADSKLVVSNNSNQQMRQLSSNSTGSIFSLKSDKNNKKPSKDIGDIDFRKSKTGLAGNPNLYIDESLSNKHICQNQIHRSRRPSGVSITNENEKCCTTTNSKVLQPNIIINASTNRQNLNSAIDCCIYNNSSVTNKDANFILKSRSPCGQPPPPSFQSKQSPAKSPFHQASSSQPPMRSVTPTTTRIIFAKECKGSPKLSIHSNSRSPIKLSSYCINNCNKTLSNRSNSALSLNSRKQLPIESTTPDSKSPALSYKSACIITKTKSNHDFESNENNIVSKTYLTNDPRLFSNHLVWNKDKHLAESIDNKYSVPSAITVISTSTNNNNNKIDPVARAMSPGCQNQLPFNGTSNTTTSNNNNNNKIDPVARAMSPCCQNQSPSLHQHIFHPMSRTNSRNEIEIKIQTANTSPLLSRPSPHHFQCESQANKLNQAKSRLNNNIKQTKAALHTAATTAVDSAYNTNSSNEDGEIEKLTTVHNETKTQCFEKYSPFFINEITKREYELNNNLNTSSVTATVNNYQGSVIDRLKMQHEENQASKKSKMETEARQQSSCCSQSSSSSTTTSNQQHKICGGVKVFPSLPHQHKQAAEMRRQRLNAIEANLVEIENKSKLNSADLNLNINLNQTNQQHDQQIAFKQTQSSSCNNVSHSLNQEEKSSVKYNKNENIYDFNNATSYKLLEESNDLEIIDLTKKVKNLEIQTTTSQVVKTNETIETQSQNIQIEILTSNNLDSNKKKDLDINKYLYGAGENKPLMNQSKLIDSSPAKTTNSCHNNCQNQKQNFIYYYDNEHFGGY